MAASLSSLVRRTITTAVRNASSSGGGAHAHDGGYKQWKMVSILVAMPAIALCMANAILSEHEHRPDFVAYEHLRLRNKRFPWGDGKKSLFHNTHSNALPEGYEDEEH
ncbi:cytochrome c oxidase subunit 6A, mitochondrial-like [Homarus americanus]|uniref:Cytochrome c oxidase subunit 6A-like n=1 Tax=Homarus americanus TaxID=6706 RepID=A0A8J5JWQ4_HOMAM|nr:cytochrome c oxidase subunit 6A, mitochondrial-like [Homarus americanus]KAG7165237.1 Cytochrome c oxidase subunit 6A-like [Homarus americanus]